MAEQRPLFDPGPRPGKLRDFAGIGDLIWPTPTWTLEQGHDLLIYRNTDAVKGIPAKHDTIFKRYVRLGEPCRHCGNAPDTEVQAIVCTGREGVTRDRQIAIYNHMHDDEQLRLARPGEIPGFIADWFHIRSGRR